MFIDEADVLSPASIALARIYLQHNKDGRVLLVFATLDGTTLHWYNCAPNAFLQADIPRPFATEEVFDPGMSDVGLVALFSAVDGLSISHCTCTEDRGHENRIQVGNDWVLTTTVMEWYCC